MCTRTCSLANLLREDLHCEQPAMILQVEYRYGKSESKELMKESDKGWDDSKIDLASYRTADFATRIGEIMSIPASVRTVLYATVFCSVLLIVVNGLIYEFSDRGMQPLFAASVYALFVGAALGFLLGVIRAARLFLRRSAGLMNLILTTSASIAKDYQSVQDGQKKLPKAGEVVEHVYGDLVVPVMEAVISRSLGLVGLPLLWAYRWTIGSAVRFLIKKTQSHSLTDNQVNEIEVTTAGVLGEITAQQNEIVTNITKAAGWTERAAEAVERILFWPLKAIFFLVTTIAILPLILIWYWSA